jgi:cell division protein FtsI (penicillin-binding protein 3)
LINGGYYHDRFVASFVGFFPADDADRVLIITVYDPKGGHFGSQVAAPVFKRVVQRLRPADAVRKSWRASPVDLADLQKSNRDGGGLPVVGYAWNWVKDQWLAAFSPSGDESQNLPADVIPDLKGKSLREAVNLLSKCGLKVEIKGSGWVVKQSLSPGTPIKNQKVCVVTAKP